MNKNNKLNFIITTMNNENIENLSIEELRKLQKQTYLEAIGNKTFYKLAEIARKLGKEKDHRYGPKYEWSGSGFYIYVDDYGHYMKVEHIDSKKDVASTHPCEEFIAQGSWVDDLLSTYWPDAEKLIQERQIKQDEEDEQKRKELLNKLKFDIGGA